MSLQSINPFIESTKRGTSAPSLRVVTSVTPSPTFDKLQVVELEGVKLKSPNAIYMPKSVKVNVGDKLVYFPVGCKLPRDYQRVLGLPVHAQHKYETGIVPLSLSAAKTHFASGICALPVTALGHHYTTIKDEKTPLNVTKQCADFIPSARSILNTAHVVDLF